MPYENKTNYTRRQLQNAMIELLEEKPFEKITINDIASHVHVNRSTVYRYYDDKYDLLETIEDQLLAEMNDLRDSFNPLADR
ncbi:TetR/AcrR family transcriptional regulator, partial [Limosilactobacillus mucosae]|nr:TetR/AcrR family transcriptional regulator [Limosilactobacillus mucosae]